MQPTVPRNRKIGPTNRHKYVCAACIATIKSDEDCEDMTMSDLDQRIQKNTFYSDCLERNSTNHTLYTRIMKVQKNPS
jgi:hypothetical protein